MRRVGLVDVRSGDMRSEGRCSSAAYDSIIVLRANDPRFGGSSRWPQRIRLIAYHDPAASKLL